MNRKEAIKKLDSIIEYYRIEIEDKGMDEEIAEIMEALEEPITLADFLGWEEGVVYEHNSEKYKIEDGRLVEWNYVDNEWYNAHPWWNEREIGELRKATKVEKKLKAYHVKDEYSYDCLMQELEEQGYLWAGRDKPTSYNAKIINGLSDWNMYIYLDDYINYSLNLYPEDYEITEYHKEEPKFRARIKEKLNIPLLARYYYFVKASKELKTSKSTKGSNTVQSIFIMTKTEWNKLGINDTNADFEEVEE